MNWIKEKLKNTWEHIKSAIGWNTVGTVVLARITAIVGFVTATVGAMDWSPLWSMLSTGTEFTKHQLIAIGVSIAGLAVTTEITRRRNDPYFTMKQATADVVEGKAVAKKAKKIVKKEVAKAQV